MRNGEQIRTSLGLDKGQRNWITCLSPGKSSIFAVDGRDNIRKKLLIHLRLHTEMMITIPFILLVGVKHRAAWSAL